ncbi:unnamed protein product, partial [Didymodactylos carnosus]
SVYMTYNSTMKNLYNIETYRFTLPRDMFYTDNTGFCVPSNSCLPDGLFTMSVCEKLRTGPVEIDLPVVASNPHFLYADQAVQASVIGLQPDDTSHLSYVDIEPMTG